MAKRPYKWHQQRTALAAVTGSLHSPKELVWAEHVGSLKQTRRLEHKSQIDEQILAKRVLKAQLGARLLLPRCSLPLSLSASSPHTPLAACVLPNSGSRHMRNVKERSQLNVFHSLLLCRSVLNTDQIMRKALLLAEGKFQEKQLILSPPLWNDTFL